MANPVSAVVGILIGRIPAVRLSLCLQIRLDLRSLHSKSGRHVGIISHVEELQERIAVQIQVNQEGNNSCSKIKIVP